MRYKDVDKFIADNNLNQTCVQAPGIYAITIDNKIAYIGESKNVYERCGKHIYNIENAILNQEKKYLLLLSAKLGGHKLDCVFLEQCEEKIRFDKEADYIELYMPPLNILTPKGKQNIEDMKIEELLENTKPIQEVI